MSMHEKIQAMHHFINESARGKLFIDIDFELRGNLKSLLAIPLDNQLFPEFYWSLRDSLEKELE